MTLRELYWAVRARRIDEWDRTASIMAWLGAKLTGEFVNPDRLNRYRPRPARTKSQIEADRAEGKIALRSMLRGLRREARR